MAKWKLCRQLCGQDVFEFTEGEEITIGRGLNNNITLPSLVISRNHCVIKAHSDNVTITDLKSANGVYIGSSKIPPNIPYKISEYDRIGFGWTVGAPLVKIKNYEKFVFMLIKTRSSPSSGNDSQGNSEKNKELSLVPKQNEQIINNEQSLDSKPILQLKRKLDDDGKLNRVPNDKFDSGVINIISDSESEPEECIDKKMKIDPVIVNLTKDHIENENEVLQYEAFNIKQEHLSFDDDEPIQIDSDSDSESEQWLLRLSQSSPGKPFTKIHTNRKDNNDKSIENSSYSQLDDIVYNSMDKDNYEDFSDDIIIIPSEPLKDIKPIIDKEEEEEVPSVPLEDEFIDFCDLDQYNANSFEAYNNEQLEEIVAPSSPVAPTAPVTPVTPIAPVTPFAPVAPIAPIAPFAPVAPIAPIAPFAPVTREENAQPKLKKAQMINPLIKPSRKSHHQSTESKPKRSIKKERRKTKNHVSSHKDSSLKKIITNSQKQERRRKLKEIADKEKETENSMKTISNNTNKVVSNVKVTLSNRGAFLTDVAKAAVKPLRRKSDAEKEKIKSPTQKTVTLNELLIDQKPVENNKSHETPKVKSNSSKALPKRPTIAKDPPKESGKSKINSSSKTSHRTSDSDHNFPIRSLKPLNDCKESQSGKPVSKVEPLPPKKPAKRVSFSNVEPIVHFFNIEPGNKMYKTSLIKTRLLDGRQKPVFSLEKITLMKILRWNPEWLDEQTTKPDPPPILGHNNPMTVFHTFVNHKQYVGLVGDLLLMEIWECITQAYTRIRSKNNGLSLKIESLPPAPPSDQSYNLFNLSVNVSLPSSDTKLLPRVGEIMIVEFGPENAKISRFFFVHNVRNLPPAKNNKTFSLSLYATFTDKMIYLKYGELMTGRSLAYINNELTLFEAMEYLAGSPLSQAILKPNTCRYPTNVNNININTQWTTALNPSQRLAVSRSICAARSDEPSIQMVQGPPGTGKSSVICAIVMNYFYDAMSRFRQNCGKILICATSNAAVDELVIRMLNIRQSLPKEERFRMVRVGRLEAMHARARDVSSQVLAQRDAARTRDEHAPPGRQHEISHLEAKINMWKTQARDAKDPVRVAYCQGKVTDLVDRINLLRGEGLRPDHLMQAERRIIDMANIIVTTLASTHNCKLKGLKGRIALCIVDEAGQAIEPETLIPLKLDVTRLTLIGDPQQLPGFICSQRAKKHGLGESLFSRLTSGCLPTDGGPVVLLDHQYRMHPAIADYPNRAFYDGRVVSVAPPPVGLDLPPYTILAISSGNKGQGVTGANEMEAWGVARVAAALAPGVRARRLALAVITPYSAHRDLLRHRLRGLQDPSESPVEVNTVDSFQGQERDVVVVSLARSNGVGFLTDVGRMNVMLTRARHALIVCLNPQAIAKNNQWQTLLDDARTRGVYKTLPNYMCQPKPSRPLSPTDILNYITDA